METYQYSNHIRRSQESYLERLRETDRLRHLYRERPEHGKHNGRKTGRVMVWLGGKLVIYGKRLQRQYS